MSQARLPLPLRLLRLLALSYACMALFACTMADKLIFFPPPPGYSATAPSLVRFSTPKQESIVALHYPAKEGKPTVLYSHGNAEDIGGSIPIYRRWRDDGWGVLAYDYPGYGHSSGKPTARSAERAIEAAWQFLTVDQAVAPESILVVGRSVGSGPSTSLLSSHHPAGLILISPFTSAFEVRPPAQYLLPGNRFRNLDRVSRSDLPVLVIHGQADRVIPHSHGQRIYEASPSPTKHFLSIPNAGHNDLFRVAGPEIFEEIRRFGESVLPGHS